MSGNNIFFIFFQQYPYIMKGKVIRIYIKGSLKEKNAFIFYQNKEDGKLDRDHRSIKRRWETLSFGDKKLD